MKKIKVKVSDEVTYERRWEGTIDVADDADDDAIHDAGVDAFEAALDLPLLTDGGVVEEQIDNEPYGVTRVYSHTPEMCPSKHWNDGDDICADCGTDLQDEDGL